MTNEFNQVKENFKEVFSNPYYLVFAFLLAVIIGYVFYIFTNMEMINANFGPLYLWILILLEVLISILFAIFLPVTVYKYVKFSSFSAKENSTSFIGTVLGVIVAGCPACSITIASYLGLASLISLLPWYGLELKLIAVPLLFYANYSSLKNLNTCKVNLYKRK